MATIFYYAIDTLYIYSWKNIEKHLTYFGDPLCKKYNFFNRTWCLTWQWSTTPVREGGGVCVQGALTLILTILNMLHTNL